LSSYLFKGGGGLRTEKIPIEGNVKPVNGYFSLQEVGTSAGDFLRVGGFLLIRDYRAGNALEVSKEVDFKEKG